MPTYLYFHYTIYPKNVEKCYSVTLYIIPKPLKVVYCTLAVSNRYSPGVYKFSKNL
jgi:hypothetical protein